eukprot:9480281-Pyramimonas_sp.AAC.1
MISINSIATATVLPQVTYVCMAGELIVSPENRSPSQCFNRTCHTYSGTSFSNDEIPSTLSERFRSNR